VGELGRTPRRIPCGTKFFAGSNFCDFRGFLRDPQKKNFRFSPAKVYSTVKIIYNNAGLKEKML